MGDWFKTNKRGFLLDFQMPDSADQMPVGQPVNLREVDTEKIVSQLHNAGVKTLYMHAKDNQGNCYYDTKFGHKHTGIGDRDLMHEFSAACRKRGMNIIYYVQLPRERRGAEVDNYAARNADGSVVMKANDKPLVPNIQESPVMCLGGPGRDYIINIVQELAKGYDFDGFWLDGYGWFGRTACYCNACKAKYFEDTGLPLPKPDDKKSSAWYQYFAWRRRQNTIIMHEIENAIRAVNPNLTITHNSSGVSDWADLEFCDLDDYVTNEFHYGSGYGHLASKCRRNSALKPNTPFEIEVWRFHSVPEYAVCRDYQVRTATQYFTEMSVILANGGMMQFYDQIMQDGKLDERSLKHLKEAFDKTALREPFLTSEQKRVGYASVVWSKQTDAFARGQQARIHDEEVEGFNNALLEKHILRDIITERNVAAGDFGDARVLILPNVNCMSVKEAENLRKFVENGGGLVATYRTSMTDESGKPRLNYLLSDLFGADYIEPLSYIYSYMKFNEEHDLTKGLPLNWPMSTWDKLQLKTKVLPGATGLGSIVNPMRGMHMGYPAQEDTPYPAVIYKTYGKGRVVYIPSPVGLCFQQFGHPDTRQLIENAVRWAAGQQQAVELEAPSAVEMVLWEAADTHKWRVHLVNLTPTGSVRAKVPVITEVLPVHDIKLRVQGTIKKAVLQPENMDLKVVHENGWSVIHMPKLEVYSIIEIINE